MDSQDLIRRQALAYERTHCCTGYTEIQILLRESTSHKLAPGGHDFILSKGYDILHLHVPYRVLAALAEKADEDRTGQLVLDKLKTTISDPWASQPWRRKQEIWRLTRQLQAKRQLHTLRSKTGQVLPDPVDGFTGAIYKCLSGHFVPLMPQTYQTLLDNPTLPETWSIALLNPIPKTASLPGVQDLRPLVLQNFCNKWVANIVALQLQDFIAAITPLQQKGFPKGRYI